MGGDIEKSVCCTGNPGHSFIEGRGMAGGSWEDTSSPVTTINSPPSYGSSSATDKMRGRHKLWKSSTSPGSADPNSAWRRRGQAARSCAGAFPSNSHSPHIFGRGGESTQRGV